MADYNHTPTSRFLEDVAEQISYKPLRPLITKELEDHILDRTEAYIEEGMNREEAEKRAVAGMGDAVTIGTELNAVRHPRTCRPLIVLTALLMLFGFCAAIYMQWSPIQNANGFLYYIPGIAILIFVTLRGYPWLIRHQTLLFRLFIALYAMELLWELLLLWKPELYSITILHHFIPFHMMRYYMVLLFAPVLAIAVYRARHRPVAAVLIPLLTASALIWFHAVLRQHNLHSVILIFLTALAATIVYMILRGVFPAVRWRQLLLAGAGCLLPLGLFAASPSHDYYLKAFAVPEAVTITVWDDAYNNLLIKELLSRTPATSGISLTPGELMDYGTARWYFESKDTAQVRQIYYDESNITLWNILPQHYHNNYLITVAVLLTGWLPALCLLALAAWFFLLLYRCIFLIRGKLAGSAAFCCGTILLMQAVLYLLGNLGYQYGTFTNLPLISEGKVSIMANMLLLGFIFSAYRYDRVIDEAGDTKNDRSLKRTAKNTKERESPI